MGAWFSNGGENALAAADIAGNQLVSLTGGNDATVGIFNLAASGASDTVAGTLWTYSNGTQAAPLAITAGTATIADASNFRVTLSIPGLAKPPVAYFTGFSSRASGLPGAFPTTAFLVGTDALADSGEIVWQSPTATNFGDSTLKYLGAYSSLGVFPVGCMPAASSGCLWSSTGWILFDGNGGYTVTVSLSTNGKGAFGPPLKVGLQATGNYAVNGDGSGNFGGSPMVTNGVRSYATVGGGLPGVDVMTKQ